MAGISASGRAELGRVLGHGATLVTVDSAAAALAVDRSAAARRLARWAEQGWLRRVRRDLYLPVPVDAATPGAWGADPLFVADAVWAPCYFTGWTTANHWGLTEQVFRTTVLKTTQRVRQSHQTLVDNDYLLAHTSAESLSWGVRREWRQERRINLADPSRTVVDTLDNPRLGGGIRLAAEYLAAYLEGGDPHLLLDYAERIGNQAVFKRLGFLVEQLSVDADELVRACQDQLSEGFPLLDPSHPPTGSRSQRWRLVVNVTVGPVDPS